MLKKLSMILYSFSSLFLQRTANEEHSKIGKYSFVAHSVTLSADFKTQKFLVGQVKGFC